MCILMYWTQRILKYAFNTYRWTPSQTHTHTHTVCALCDPKCMAQTTIFMFMGTNRNELLFFSLLHSLVFSFCLQRTQLLRTINKKKLNMKKKRTPFWTEQSEERERASRARAPLRFNLMLSQQYLLQLSNEKWNWINNEGNKNEFQLFQD